MCCLSPQQLLWIVVVRPWARYMLSLAARDEVRCIDQKLIAQWRHTSPLTFWGIYILLLLLYFWAATGARMKPRSIRQTLVLWAQCGLPTWVVTQAEHCFFTFLCLIVSECSMMTTILLTPLIEGFLYGSRCESISYPCLRTVHNGLDRGVFVAMMRHVTCQRTLHLAIQIRKLISEPPSDALFVP